MEYLYKKFRNKVVSEIRKSKVEYYTEYFNKYKSNMKMLWTGIRSIVDVKYKAGSTISHLIGADNAEVDDSKEMANIFNVFVDTATKINEKIPRTEKSPLDYLSSRNLNAFFISAVSPNEVENIIGSLKSGKAVGPYGIPIFFLKLLSQYISLPLSDIINSSFVNGIFPDLLKLASHTFIQKAIIK